MGAKNPCYTTVTSCLLGICNILLVSGRRWIQFYKAANSEVRFYKPTFLDLAFL